MHTLVKKSFWIVAGSLLAIACDGPDYASGGSRGLPPPEADPLGDPTGDSTDGDPAGEGDPEIGGDADGDGYVDGVTDFGELGPEWETRLEARTPDYSQALRIASLRLRGELPSLLEIHFVAEA